MWMIKPADENQGRGIKIFYNDFDSMKEFIQSNKSTVYWIVQKYIERPLLYYGRKFDIRVWGLITWKQNLYIYKPGYIRTSSNEYITKSNVNFVHLTNNCLQQYGKNYGVFEDGNTVSFLQFEKYLKEQFPQHNIDLNKHFLTRIKDLMIDSYFATKFELHLNRRPNFF